MNNLDNHKLLLALLLLLFTASWSYFTVYATTNAIVIAKVSNIIVGAGANQVLGALLTLDTLVFQHYFRKVKPE